jgi:hypothetical protein
VFEKAINEEAHPCYCGGVILNYYNKKLEELIMAERMHGEKKPPEEGEFMNATSKEMGNNS